MKEKLMPVLETTNYKGHRIQISPDESPENPRTEYDNFGTMICFHGRYNLGDPITPDEVHDPESAEQWLKDNDVICLEIFMMDHSGLSLSTSRAPFQACDPMGWDWGKIGVIAVTREKARSELGKRRLMKADVEQVEKILQSEVEVYGQYLNGEIYGYEILNEDEDDDEVIDSCWGYYGYDYCLESAKQAVDYYSSETVTA